ncbi:MAG: acyl-CoA carboxylase subunit beta, partial [Acidobacteria bacterium]|nr:acyl-CoA carboxylase subunit beta [Acidobacteriota bacterium]
QVIDSEPLGGAYLHTATSGVAHYRAKDDGECLAQIRERFRALPAPAAAGEGATAPARNAAELYGILPADHRLPYEIEDVILRIFDAADYREFQPEFAPEMLCANARVCGRPVALIANRRGFLKQDGRPRIGGIVYTDSARKVAYFVENADREGTPLVYLQDVSGFMVGPDAEREGIIRAGAEMVETMSCATVPKIVVTLNHASGAGYYAMAGQGFDPTFTFSWPTARIGVMEGDSAVVALYSGELSKHKGGPLPEELREAIERTRADYEKWLDVKYAAARGHCDAVIDPMETRAILEFALAASRRSSTGLPACMGDPS